MPKSATPTASSPDPSEMPSRVPALPSRTIGASGALIAAVLSSAMAGVSGRADEPKVEITGGGDVTANYQWYNWTVTNRHSSPIVFVQFPHYHADTFNAPAGWNKESTYMPKPGVPDRPGTCTAWVDSPEQGIIPRRSAEFSIRLGLGRVAAQHRPGEVIVRFADGTEAIVAGVEVPTAPTTPERLVALIGFALIFGIIVLVRMRRRRKARAATQPDAAAGAGDE